jgi:hypothetical protein
MLNYYRISDPNDVRDLGEQMAAWQAAGNPKANDWAVVPAAPSDDAVWSDGAWSVPPVATVTAEEHLKSVGLAGDRQPTLLYLRQSLAAAGQQSPELDAIEQYLQQILAIFASDPSPRNDWPQPPVSFETAVQSAMQTLLVTPEQSVGGNP